MMVENRCEYSYEVSGTAALKVRNDSSVPKLVVIDGGLNKVQQSRKPDCRGFLVGAVIAMALVATFFVFEIFEHSCEVAAIQGAPTESVKVFSGDSLWALAQSHTPPGASVESVVSWIRDANNLTNSTIYAGQELLVPRC